MYNFVYYIFIKKLYGKVLDFISAFFLLKMLQKYYQLPNLGTLDMSPPSEAVVQTCRNFNASQK